MLTGSALQGFANTLGSNGFLKTWKANGIAFEVNANMINSDRLIPYLTNALEMEGFRKLDIEKIDEYIIRNMGSNA